MATPHVRLTSRERTTLDRVGVEAIEFRNAVRQLATRQARFDATLRWAVHDEGCTGVDVADAAGISRQGLYNAMHRDYRRANPQLGDDVE